MILNSLISSLVYSPLEQFDSATWVYTEHLFENVSSFSNYVFETEYDIFSLSLLNGNLILNSLNAPLFVMALIALFIYARTAGYTFFINDFSHLFLLGFIHLFTGSFIFLWFDDFVAEVLKDEGAQFAGSTLKNFWHSTGAASWISADQGSVAYTFNPQIDFALVWDENFISFLAAFFLLGGAEEEDDEDFILEEEGSDIIEDIVAPLFVDNLGKDVEDNGALYLKVCGIFGFVLFNNVMGMLPYSDTGTSSLILTFWVAFAVFGSLLFLMMRKHGVHYFFNLFLPSGSPVPLMFILVPIEFISYTFRLVSLSVRLFANMMAGHTLLKVIVGFSWTMILMGDFFLVANLFPVLILFVLTFLELGVAAVQAYIFTILTCIYLKDIFVGH